MKKFLAAALALCMTSAALTSCGDSNSSSAADSNSAAANSQASDSSAADTESVSDKLLAEYPASTEKIDVKNGATENMIARSVINEGDTSRLAAKLDYALQNPKETTKICFIGDSITAGSGANSSTNQYVNQFKSRWVRPLEWATWCRRVRRLRLPERGLGYPHIYLHLWCLFSYF